jgi:hypothetical protein
MRWSMLKRLAKKGGNKYTLISIIIILLMMYFIKSRLGVNETNNYPNYVNYKDYNFEYRQTIRESSFKFVRKYGANYEGHILLIKRGENWNTAPSKVYIFVGSKTYREYDLVK